MILTVAMILYYSTNNDSKYYSNPIFENLVPKTESVSDTRSPVLIRLSLQAPAQAPY